MTYNVKEGRRLLGIATAGRPAALGAWAHIFIDCQECDQSIGLRFDNNADADKFTDGQFAEVVTAFGWQVEPPICEKCRTGA